MKRAQPSLSNLSLLGQDDRVLSGSEAVSGVLPSGLIRDSNTQSGVASSEKTPGSDFSVQLVKEGGGGSDGSPGCQKETNEKSGWSRSLFGDDEMDNAACSVEEQKEDAEVKALGLDPAVKAFNLNPAMKAVQIDWRFKEGVKKPVYHSLATIITNHIPFSNPRKKSYVKYASEVDELFDTKGKFSRMPKEEPLPDKKVFTEKEKETLQELKAGKVFDTPEEGMAALRLHNELLRNLFIDKQAEDRRLGRKPWMMFFEDENGERVGWDMYVRYHKEHPAAFTQRHNVWHRLEELHYNPKKTFCHTLDDDTNCPY